MGAYRRELERDETLYKVHQTGCTELSIQRVRPENADNREHTTQTILLRPRNPTHRISILLGYSYDNPCHLQPLQRRSLGLSIPIPRPPVPSFPEN